MNVFDVIKKFKSYVICFCICAILCVCSYVFGRARQSRIDSNRIATEISEQSEQLKREFESTVSELDSAREQLSEINSLTTDSIKLARQSGQSIESVIKSLSNGLDREADSITIVKQLIVNNSAIRTETENLSRENRELRENLERIKESSSK